MPPMNPKPYLHAFAWIPLVALGCTVVSDFWLPMLLGAVVVAVAARISR